MTITHERNCDNCIHFRWYYDLCKKFGIEVDGDFMIDFAKNICSLYAESFLFTIAVWIAVCFVCGWLGVDD